MKGKVYKTGETIVKEGSRAEGAKVLKGSERDTVLEKNITGTDTYW